MSKNNITLVTTLSLSLSLSLSFLLFSHTNSSVDFKPPSLFLSLSLSAHLHILLISSSFNHPFFLDYCSFFHFLTSNDGVLILESSVRDLTSSCFRSPIHAAIATASAPMIARLFRQKLLLDFE